MSKEKIPGIIGGMGPEATADLLLRIVRNTPALDDGDHIRCIIDNNPKVPSRMKAILEGDGNNPGPCMAEMGRKLEAWGADFLAIPCNTAHYYHHYVQAAVSVPVLHMIDLTVRSVLEKRPDLKKAGLLAAPMVRVTGMYEERFAACGVEMIYPAEDMEQLLFSYIKGVKKGDTGPEQRDRLRRVKESILARGAETVVLACTEIGLLMPEDEITVDAAEVLAKAIVEEAKS